MRLFWGSWAIFAGYCVWGTPPCVDLPAHGTQLQNLSLLLAGDERLAALYEVKFSPGYGLPYWLFLPLAWLTSGATAVRVALWATLMAFPLSHLLLARAFKRPDWVVLLGLPLAFNISYWYGLLSGLFAQPLAFFCVAAFVRALETKQKRWLLAVNLLALATLLSHQLAFAALGVALAALAIGRRDFGRSLRALALGLALPVALSLPTALTLSRRALDRGDWPETRYDLASHFNWFFKHYGPEGSLAAVGPLLVAAICLVAWFKRRQLEPAGPVVMTLSLALLYLVTPKTLSGIFLASVRLPVFAGMLALLVVDPRALWAPVRAVLLCLSFASLLETAVFHHRFARELDGLAELSALPPRGTHGYLSLAGARVLGSKHIYLEHAGQWRSARWGGVTNDFFADAEHHPVQFKEGAAKIPAQPLALSREELQVFDELLTYGEQPLPPQLDGFTEAARAGRWRLLRR